MWKLHVHSRQTYDDLAVRYMYSIPWIQHLLDDYRAKMGNLGGKNMNSTLQALIPTSKHLRDGCHILWKEKEQRVLLNPLGV